uniref:Cullin family profile domain-containing protein n=1 Tax=Leishmania guyanensis TaxID=5670 RepID=A0A1E1IV30_LEIGU|nr:hypothetical protein, conserved [Leishmania guyanensis]
MHNSTARRRTSAEPQRQTQEGHHQKHEDAAHNQRQGSYMISSSGAALEGAQSLQAAHWARYSSRAPQQQPEITQNVGGTPASLLLSRSIRDQTHPRTTGSPSSVISARRAHSADDKNNTSVRGNESLTIGMPRSLSRHTTAFPSHYLSTSSPSTSSSSPTTASTAELEMPMQLESLWSNIDRYLFAVYTTLQTGDESSLRSLRCPKHRMSWYTVIYNACSGDPTKSRELYARLALLLLHLLESHVLFPILQNVDHSRVQFLTGTEDYRGTHGSGSAQQDQSSRSAPTESGATGGSSSSGWSRFKNIAAAAATSEPVHRAPSKETNRSSSYRRSSSGHGNTNGSFAFVRRLLYPSSYPTETTTAARTTPVGGEGSKISKEKVSARWPPQSPRAPATPAPVDGGAITSSSVVGRGTSWFGQQGSSARWGAAPTSGPHGTFSHHHARVASKTGRVLVDAEEEVLSEVNTISPASRHSPRRLQLRESSSDSSSAAALASFNDTEEGSPGLRTGADDDEDESLHTMNSYLSSEHIGPLGRIRTSTHSGEDTSAAAVREGGMAELPTNAISSLTSTLTPGDHTLSPSLSPDPSVMTPIIASNTTSSPVRDTAVTLAPSAASVTTNEAAASPTVLVFSATATTATPAAHAADPAHPNERRFSLCYTFLQEWRTFLVFRSVVLSCFRYLDQYYTRRFGMDTITLMCFKVFYVVVYEPLRPLLRMELRYLMQYVREVFETTDQVAWEQLGLIQETYRVITELLLLVQSTSSSMVAQQQQQQQTGPSVSGGGGGTAAAVGAATASAARSPNIMNTPPSLVAPFAEGVSSVVDPLTIATSAVAETSERSHSGSRARSAVSGHNFSTPSSAASTPNVGLLDTRNSASTAATPSPVVAGGERSGAHSHVSRRRRLLSLFTSGRLGDGAKGGSNSGRAQRATSTPADLRPSLASAASSAAGQPAPFESNRGVGADNKDMLRSKGGRDGDSGGLSARDEADGRSDQQQEGAVKSYYIAAPAVVVDLRGTVELRDRLEGHTAAHHLTTQALKQWEGMPADRRPRLGTIIKEIAKPLTTIVMEDVANEYVAGIYAFYRYRRDAHRRSEQGRRGYVAWAVSVKELERHVWRRVQLPFLHASLRSALNEVLVVEPHRSILLDTRFGLRALLDAWSANVEAAGLCLAPQMSATTAWSSGAAAQVGGSEYLESLISTGLRGSHQSRSSPFPHQRTTRSPFFEADEMHEETSPISFSFLSGEEEKKDDGRHSGSGGGDWCRVQWTTAASGDSHSTVVSAINRGSGNRLTEDRGAWAGRGRGERHPSTVAVGSTPRGMSSMDNSIWAPPKEAATSAASAPYQGLAEQPSPSSGTTASVETSWTISGEAEGDLASALVALESLYRLFTDVTKDECFVLMAAILITKLIRDAADIIERYLCAVSRPASAAPSQPHPQTPGIEFMAGLVGLMARYTDLVESVFHNHATVLGALFNAIEELMCPFRWTRKGALQASQQRAHEALMAAAATATPRALGRSLSQFASSAGADLPNVLLSRDARQASMPLIALAANYPQAVQQLKLSVLVARYVDFLLQQECRGSRVLSGNLHKRLRLVAQLVALLEDKDTFLEHYRLFLARRLLSYSSGPVPPQSGAPPGTVSAAVGGKAKQALAVGRAVQRSSASFSPNLEEERLLVSFLQSHLGVTATHAFEAMLRDYEGAERTRNLFEQKLAYLELPAKIRVQLIASAQWPAYPMPPLQAHTSLQRGMEAFRDHYARQHPSRALLWVFSLGSATLTAEFVSGTKQVVASTLSATLLLVVSDAYNAEAPDAAQAGVLTGVQLARILGLPFHALRAHLHLLTQHRAFNLLRWIPANSGAGAAAAFIMENDSFSLNPSYAHTLRAIRLPLPKAHPTDVPSGGPRAFDGSTELATRSEPSTTSSRAAAPVTAFADEDAVVARHVQATRRVLLDAALVHILKSHRVVLFEDLFQTVAKHLSRQFVPSRRDIKAQLEGLIDRDYVKRSPNDPKMFIYLS